MKRISILGCGWLGWALACRLLSDGHTVKGSTTTPEKMERLEADGIQPALLTLTPELRQDEDDDFFESDVLFLNIPPPHQRDDLLIYHLAQIASVAEAIQNSPIDFVIFASSTSVYANTGEVVTETNADDPNRPTGEALRAAEALLQQSDGFDVTVLRLAGLYGPDRSPGRFLADRTDVPGPEAPVNLVHRDDVIGIVQNILRQDVRGEVFNVCATGHPTRRQFYTRAAEALGRVPPTFSDKPKPYKIVSNEKIREQLGYQFQHSHPLAEIV